MQKTFYLILVFIGLSLSLGAQTTGVTDEYTNMDEYPRFPGCDKEGASVEDKEECAEMKLLQYVYSNIKYPETAKAAKVEGPIAVKFTVTEAGKIQNPTIVKSLGSGCDEELIRVISIMPDWSPGKTGGAPQKADFILAMKFKL